MNSALTAAPELDTFIQAAKTLRSATYARSVCRHDAAPGHTRAVTRKLQTWIALRGREPEPLFLQVCKGGGVLAGRRLSGDGVHKVLQEMGAKLGAVIRPHGLRHAAITAALDETNGNVRAAREFSGHASVEVLMIYDDNRKDVGGEVASKVVRRISKFFQDDSGSGGGA